ncbi:unnamed protein product [Ectocarpus sp. 4 AP-2014]
MQVQCKLCGKGMAGTTERMAAHFAKRTNFGVSKCTKPTTASIALGRKVLGDYESSRAAAKKRKAETAVIKARQTFIRRKDNGVGKEAADKTFLRFLTATGQSFSVGESPYFRDFVDAVSKVPGWTARNRRSLTGADLDAEYRKVDVESKARLERNGLQRGKTLQTDGMTTKSGVPLVNIIESIDGEERFLAAVDTSGHKKDMPYLLTLIEPHICADTDLIVSDGACGGLLTLVEQKHPRITGMKCGAHAVDLLIKDCAKFQYFADIIKRMTKVIQFVKNHHGTSAIYADKTKLRLITPCATRFATNVMVAMRMNKVQLPLKNFASDPRTGEYIRTATTKVREAGRAALKEINEGDALQGEFWFEVNFFVQMMTPLYELLRMGDGVLPCMSKFLNGFMKIPQRWDHVVELQQDVTKATEGEGWKDPDVLARVPDMKDKAESRLEYVWNPMMSAAWILDPEYRSMDLAKNPHGGRMLLDTTAMFKRLLIDHGTDSKAAIAAAAELPGGGPVGKAGAQLGLFRTGKWEGAELLSFAESMSPADWWQTYGLTLPELAKVALRVTSKVPASAGAERNWSLYGDVTGGKHARMSVERAQKQVFVRANLRLQHKDYKKRAFIAWDRDAVESDGSVDSDDEGEDAIENGDGSDDDFDFEDAGSQGVEF